MGNTNFKASDIQQSNYQAISKANFVYHFCIGKGGFGKVWRVERKKAKQTFAMKEMSKARIITKRSVKSVMNERQILAQLQNTFLVNMYYAFQDRENLYLVMDYLSGGDLRYHICRYRRFNEETTQFFVACLVAGLEYIHEKKIIHRDIKPENLVIEDDGYLRITDFGIARVWREENAQDTSGTPGYMAPEVMCRQNHTTSVDFFAVGVMAYECMFGKKPSPNIQTIGFQETTLQTGTLLSSNSSYHVAICITQRPYVGKSRKEIRDHILSKQIQIKRGDIPRGWSIEAADFINKMIQRKPQNRLGNGGAHEVKNHPWLRNFPWEKLEQKKVKAPFLPPNEDNFDQKNINEEWKDLEDDLFKENHASLRKQSTQDLFQGYYYDFQVAALTQNPQVIAQGLDDLITQGINKLEFATQMEDPLTMPTSSSAATLTGVYSTPTLIQMQQNHMGGLGGKRGDKSRASMLTKSMQQNQQNSASVNNHSSQQQVRVEHVGSHSGTASHTRQASAISNSHLLAQQQSNKQHQTLIVQSNSSNNNPHHHNNRSSKQHQNHHPLQQPYSRLDNKQQNNQSSSHHTNSSQLNHHHNSNSNVNSASQLSSSALHQNQQNIQHINQQMSSQAQYSLNNQSQSVQGSPYRGGGQGQGQGLKMQNAKNANGPGMQSIQNNFMMNSDMLMNPSKAYVVASSSQSNKNHTTSQTASNSKSTHQQPQNSSSLQQQIFIKSQRPLSNKTAGTSGHTRTGTAVGHTTAASHTISHSIQQHGNISSQSQSNQHQLISGNIIHSHNYANKAHHSQSLKHSRLGSAKIGGGVGVALQNNHSAMTQSQMSTLQQQQPHHMVGEKHHAGQKGGPHHVKANSSYIGGNAPSHHQQMTMSAAYLNQIPGGQGQQTSHHIHHQSIVQASNKGGGIVNGVSGPLSSHVTSSGAKAASLNSSAHKRNIQQLTQPTASANFKLQKNVQTHQLNLQQLNNQHNLNLASVENHHQLQTMSQASNKTASKFASQHHGSSAQNRASVGNSVNGSQEFSGMSSLNMKVHHNAHHQSSSLRQSQQFQRQQQLLSEQQAAAQQALLIQSQGPTHSSKQHNHNQHQASSQSHYTTKNGGILSQNNKRASAGGIDTGLKAGGSFQQQYAQGNNIKIANSVQQSTHATKQHNGSNNTMNHQQFAKSQCPTPKQRHHHNDMMIGGGISDSNGGMDLMSSGVGQDRGARTGGSAILGGHNSKNATNNSSSLNQQKFFSRKVSGTSGLHSHKQSTLQGGIGSGNASNTISQSNSIGLNQNQNGAAVSHLSHQHQLLVAQQLKTGLSRQIVQSQGHSRRQSGRQSQIHSNIVNSMMHHNNHHGTASLKSDYKGLSQNGSKNANNANPVQVQVISESLDRNGNHIVHPSGSTGPTTSYHVSQLSFSKNTSSSHKNNHHHNNMQAQSSHQAYSGKGGHHGNGGLNSGLTSHNSSIHQTTYSGQAKHKSSNSVQLSQSGAKATSSSSSKQQVNKSSVLHGNNQNLSGVVNQSNPQYHNGQQYLHPHHQHSSSQNSHQLNGVAVSLQASSLAGHANQGQVVGAGVGNNSNNTNVGHIKNSLSLGGQPSSLTYDAGARRSGTAVPGARQKQIRRYKAVRKQ